MAYRLLVVSICFFSAALILQSCVQRDNTSLTVSLPYPTSSFPHLSFPDLDSLSTPPIHWKFITDTTVVASFSISEQQIALLTLPSASSSTLLLLSPRQPVRLSFRASPPSVYDARQSVDFHCYLNAMARICANISDADSAKRISVTDSMRNYTLKYIRSNPLSKGVLIALQAVGPDSTKLIPIEENFPLYLYLDSLLNSTYHHSQLMRSLSAAIAKYQHCLSLPDSLREERYSPAQEVVPSTSDTTMHILKPGNANGENSIPQNTNHPLPSVSSL